MRKSLFLYLFIFAVLLNIFTYMYFTNKQKYEQGRIVNLEKRVTALTDTIKGSEEKIMDATYFRLENNDNAMEYFGDDADIDAIALKVVEGVRELNANKMGNPLTQMEPMNGTPFIINKIQILNNRWIIADYSNGKAWGEVLIKYFLNDDGTVDYETIQTLLHANTVN